MTHLVKILAVESVNQATQLTHKEMTHACSLYSSHYRAATEATDDRTYERSSAMTKMLPPEC
jgi:hypothetical protein